MTCLSPGNWLSEDGTIAAMHMMEGTPHAMWELYLTQLAKGEVRRVPKDPDDTDFLCADHWCTAFTFGELADDVAKLADWRHNLARSLSTVCERQAQDRAWGFGPPDPALGWYPYHHGQRAIQPMLRSTGGDSAKAHRGKLPIDVLHKDRPRQPRSR